VAAAVVDEWVHVTAAMLRKRRGLKRLVDRILASAARTALRGWAERARELAGREARAALVESRCALLRKRSSVRALAANSARSRLLGRHKGAFDHRWRMTRLKNTVDCWSQWCQKKMAVKVGARLLAVSHLLDPLPSGFCLRMSVD
jgi:hypothetical protein